MKKLLAIILSVICLFSCMAVPANAATGGGVIGEIASDFFSKLFDVEFEEDTPLGYGVIYEIDSFSGVKLIYKPTPTIRFENPGLYTITSDTPLAINHEFVCWKDGKGNNYYAGDKVYVDGMITLYAVWTEKTDNDVSIVRILKTTIEALKRLIGSFLGVFKTVVEFDKNYKPTEPDAPRLYDVKVNEALYENSQIGNERILFYLDSLTFYDYGMARKELTGNEKASIYFCTGWHEATREPLNRADYECAYTFSAVQGANNSDVIIISTYNDGKEITAEYAEGLTAGQTYYMVVTVGESLYYSDPATSGKLYTENTNPITCVFTFTK